MINGSFGFAGPHSTTLGLPEKIDQVYCGGGEYRQCPEPQSVPLPGPSPSGIKLAAAPPGYEWIEPGVVPPEIYQTPYGAVPIHHGITHGLVAPTATIYHPQQHPFYTGSNMQVLPSLQAPQGNLVPYCGDYTQHPNHMEQPQQQPQQLLLERGIPHHHPLHADMPTLAPPDDHCVMRSPVLKSDSDPTFSVHQRLARDHQMANERAHERAQERGARDHLLSATEHLDRRERDLERLESNLEAREHERREHERREHERREHERLELEKQHWREHVAAQHLEVEHQNAMAKREAALIQERAEAAEAAHTMELAERERQVAVAAIQHADALLAEEQKVAWMEGVKSKIQEEVAKGVAAAEWHAEEERQRREMAEARETKLMAVRAKEEIVTKLAALEAMESRLAEAKMADAPLSGGSLVQHPLLKDDVARVLQEAAVLTATPIRTPIRIYGNESPSDHGNQPSSPVQLIAVQSPPKTGSPTADASSPGVRPQV